MLDKENTLKNFLNLENINDRYITDLNTNKKIFSYAELCEEIENFRNFFQSINIKKGYEISIILFNSIEYVLAFLSINFNHNICLPQNTNLKKEEYERYLVNNCKYIIVHDYDENNDNYASIKKKHGYYKNVLNSLEELSKEHNIGLIKIKKNNTKPYFTYSYIPNGRDVEKNEIKKQDNVINNSESNKDICLHLHTSGTTSKVKIVQLTNNNIKTTIKNIVNSYDINKNDNTIIVMPLYHVHGLIGVLMPILFSKGNILFQLGHSFSASEFWNNIMDYNISYFSAIPTILKILLLRYEKDYLRKDSDRKKVQHKLRFIRTSSSYLDELLEKEIEEKFETQVFQAYGMTEACHQVSSNKLINNDNNKNKICMKKLKSVGIPNVGVVIYDAEKKKVCDYNTLGEICINGKNVMYGYKEIKDNEHIYVYVNTIKEKTQYMIDNKFLEISENVPFFKTGDIGYIDEDNFLFLSGRIKDIINRGGEKIIPNEIDDVLRTHPIIQDCLTFGSKDDVYGEIINTSVIVKDIYLDDNNKNMESETESKLNIETLKQDNKIIESNDNSKEETEFDVNKSIELNLNNFHKRFELKEHMKKELADFKVPKNIYFVNNFLKTDTGKISRKKVYEGIELIKNKDIPIFDIIAIILKKYEISHIYGVYGIPINKIIKSFIKNKIYYISFRNEINAAISCSYVNYFSTQNKKKVGIIFACSGPGFMNTISGLYNAKINNLPMVLISFENYIDNNLTLYEKYNNFQYFPQFNFLNKSKEICNSVYHANSLNTFSEQFDKAINRAIEYKAPVYLNLDYKMINQTVNIEQAFQILEIVSKNVNLYFSQNNDQVIKIDLLNIELDQTDEIMGKFLNLVKRIKQIYKSNNNGVIFIGSNCNNGIKYVLKLSKLLKIPIYTNTMGKSFIKENYIYNVNSCKSFLFNNLDFCILIGSPYNFYFNFGHFPMCKKENMVCIDLNNVEEAQKNDEKVNHFFFNDLYFILKKLYFTIKEDSTLLVNMDSRQNWVNILNKEKKKNIYKICTKIATQYFDKNNNTFTMEQAFLILRNILINYYFAQNDIPIEYKKYFINYFQLFSEDQIQVHGLSDIVYMSKDERKKLKDNKKMISEQLVNNNFENINWDSFQEIEEDCDLDYTSSDENKSNNKIEKKEGNKFLNKKVKKRVIITNEGSISLIMGILYLPKFGLYNYVIPQINGMMGISMNAAISASLENKNNIIFSILGDSSFGFTCNEIETICRLKLKIVIIIINNNGIYGTRDFEINPKIEIKYINNKTFDPQFYLNNPSALYHFSKYENYITAHGGYGAFIDSKEELIKQMTYITSDKFDHFPVLLNILVKDTGSVHFDADKCIL
ncbi:acyl-CoA synthetase, putative [Plasmodium berghei]|uniref:Acyl-CoA synthetase, putative n=2 Tax=Plasmodium berghei TaxID=5821 RepID=A0A509APG5_PLABA|nr:acyl-CoA synthetase, putative [Plasmodium berghei ANKA]CXI63422.1 acyl-CoA synthetase, putative [Plasmodium berghei]SCM23793.1 acyl-CoA synthetase, putative [Plasmodium berghei]SCN26777.1 acyl-CoA synthetase, putative [Plasmodium berghei]SCO61114.1 acyl-CoA synthetase, putative [Plasmodium berghei]SCO63196.1 acyl-CoA synthetase, putative [Plasmodium berghei]|eukprot:XP_034422394.1 acyl-CoA synthetase, putative [Plasmodium berghei ANKA]